MKVRVVMLVHGFGEQALMPSFAEALVNYAGVIEFDVTFLSNRRAEHSRMFCDQVQRLCQQHPGRVRPKRFKDGLERKVTGFDVLISGMFKPQQLEACKAASRSVGFFELLVPVRDDGSRIDKLPGGGHRFPKVAEECSAILSPCGLVPCASKYLTAIGKGAGASVLSLGLPETTDSSRIDSSDISEVLFIKQKHMDKHRYIDEDRVRGVVRGLGMGEGSLRVLEHPRGKAGETIGPIPNAKVVVTEYSNLAYAYALRGCQVIYCMNPKERPALLPLHVPGLRENCQTTTLDSLGNEIEKALVRAKEPRAPAVPSPAVDVRDFVAWVRETDA